MKKIRVLIVEDSDVVRELLTEIIGHDRRLEVAAAVSSAEEGLDLLAKIAPDVISLDIRLPGMNGLQATQKIMSERPTPIVIVSASVEKEDLKISINALKAGALAIVEKPVGMTRPEYREMAEFLCTQLAIMSQVKLVRQRRSAARGLFPKALEKKILKGEDFRVVGVAASTGGPNALEKFLKGLPPGFPLPILIVQHIVPSFLEGFVAWLGDACSFPVSLAQDGQAPEPGHVYVAPADRHLKIESGRLRLSREPAISNQRPSASALFESMARELGPQALGVLLTGMGDDGAKGLLEIRNAGGYTIAEDESTSTVYGMPAAAVRLGAVCESLPVHEIAWRMTELVCQGEIR